MSSKLILYIAASKDGFIAKKDGDVNWLHDPKFLIEGEDYGYGALMNSLSTTIMGRKTYDQILGFDCPWPYPNTKNFVYSNSQTGSNENVEFTNVSPEELLKSIDGNCWLIGGKGLNELFLKSGLIDEIILTEMPIELGEGIALFDAPWKENFKEMESKTWENGVKQITYQKN